MFLLGKTSTFAVAKRGDRRQSHSRHRGLIANLTHHTFRYFLPVTLLLKALVPGTTDRAIFAGVVGDRAGSDRYLADRVALLLREYRNTPGLADQGGHYSQQAALRLLGSRFRELLELPSKPRLSDTGAGVIFLNRFILVHLSKGAQYPTDLTDTEDTADVEVPGGRAKFNLLCLMLRKLYAFASGTICK